MHKEKNLQRFEPGNHLLLRVIPPNNGYFVNSAIHDIVQGELSFESFGPVVEFLDFMVSGFAA